MTNALRRGAQLLAAVYAVVALSASAQSGDFYEQQLRQGRADFLAGHMVPATDELRVAAFGFLERPPLLTEALVRLALARNALSQPAQVSQTLNRFLEVERKFGAYSVADIEQPTRAAFEGLLVKTVPHSELAAIVSLGKIVRSDAARVSELPVERRAGAYEQGFRHSPRDIDWPLEAARDFAGRGMDDQAIRWGRRALSIDAENPAAKIILVHAYARKGDCKDALSQINAFPKSNPNALQQVTADQFVCLTELGRWAEADASYASVAESERSRSDVVRAAQELAARKGAPTKRLANDAALKPSSSTSPTTAARPSAASKSDVPQVSVIPSPSVASANANPADPTTITSASTSTIGRQQKRVESTPSAQVLANSRLLVKAGKYAEASTSLKAAVAGDPTNRDLRIALLEAASLSRDWPTAVAQITPTEPFRSGEEASMFYAASALYETGRKGEARPLMERARPRLPSIPIVNYYLQAILGVRPK